MIRKIYNVLTGKAHRQRMDELKWMIAEVDRQQSRVSAAYDLQLEVMIKYGVEFVPYLTPPEQIIVDTKSITMVNYLNVDFIQLI